MSKQESLIVKGVAILLMLYFHLFHREWSMELCQTYLSVGDEPLVHWLTRATNPVAFFLILSGYGLYVSRGSSTARKDLKRISRYLEYC